eukprot:4753050-Pyramimonas_sp.AAC.1
MANMQAQAGAVRQGARLETNRRRGFRPLELQRKPQDRAQGGAEKALRGVTVDARESGAAA